MSRLLGRSKSHRHKATRQEPQQECDMLRAPAIDRNGRNIMPAQVATGPGRWVDTPDIQPRPKTSNAAIPPSWNHTKEGPPIVITADDEVFLFPTPTPRKANFSPALACSPSTPASAVRPEPDVIEIGVAIGSPSQIQHSQSPQPRGLRKPGSHGVFSPAQSTGSLNESQEPRHDMNDTSRPKISRWRSLGRVFSKRDRNAAHHLERQPLREPDCKADNLIMRSPANSCPAQFDQARDAPNKCKQSAKQSTKQSKGIEYPATLPTHHPSTALAGRPAPPKRPILDIDIPDIQLERYSVMFSGLIPNRQSNLLARRQGDKAATLKVSVNLHSKSSNPLTNPQNSPSKSYPPKQPPASAAAQPLQIHQRPHPTPYSLRQPYASYQSAQTRS